MKKLLTIPNPEITTKAESHYPNIPKIFPSHPLPKAQTKYLKEATTLVVGHPMTKEVSWLLAVSATSSRHEDSHISDTRT